MGNAAVPKPTLNAIYGQYLCGEIHNTLWKYSFNRAHVLSIVVAALSSWLFEDDNTNFNLVLLLAYAS